MSSNYGVIPMRVSPDCCVPGSCQGIIDLVATHIAVEDVRTIRYIYGPSPKPANPDAAWIRDQDGQLYIPDLNQSVWKREHPVPPGSAFLYMWAGVENPDLWRVDGGDGTDPMISGNTGEFTGSFWKVDHQFDGYSPIGVGYIGEDTEGTKLTPLQTFGEEKHTLTIEEMPKHTHKKRMVPLDDAVPSLLFGGGDPKDTGGRPEAEFIPDYQGEDKPHNTVHPVRAVYMIRRTARRWITISFI